MTGIPQRADAQQTGKITLASLKASRTEFAIRQGKDAELSATLTARISKITKENAARITDAIDREAA